jgi:hypothetical protein
VEWQKVARQRALPSKMGKNPFDLFCVRIEVAVHPDNEIGAGIFLVNPADARRLGWSVHNAGNLFSRAG